MGKQTMGTTSHSLPYRTDNKMYRIITPQSPIVKPALYNDYSMDNYPNGTNAIVAVISYTGNYFYFILFVILSKKKKL